MKYDYVVFTSMEVPPETVEMFKQVAKPANLTVILDTPGITEEIALMSDKDQQEMENVCGKNWTDITFWDRCRDWKNDNGKFIERLAYKWQAEFRAKHIWVHDGNYVNGCTTGSRRRSKLTSSLFSAALKPYRYMMWIDSDTFATRVWRDTDPIAEMIRNDLVLLVGNFGAGISKGAEIHKRIKEAFGHSVCSIGVKHGHLHAVLDTNDQCGGAGIDQVHGFFHIRSERAINKLVSSSSCLTLVDVLTCYAAILTFSGRSRR